MENIILYVVIAFTICFCIYNIIEYIKFVKMAKEQEKEFNLLLNEIADDLKTQITKAIIENYKEEQCKNNTEKKQAKRGRKPKTEKEDK